MIVSVCECEYEYEYEESDTVRGGTRGGRIFRDLIGAVSSHHDHHCEYTCDANYGPFFEGFH